MYKSFELDLSTAEEWEKYLDRIDYRHRDIYFSPDYYRLYENYGDGTAKCFVLTEGDDVAIYPFLMNAIDRKAYELKEDYYDIQGAYGYNGTLYTTSRKDFVDAFNTSFNEYCREKNIVAEFTRFHPLLENKDFSKDRMTVIDDRETVYLDLRPDLEDIWKDHFTSAVRNKIRKASKRNYTSELLKNPDDKAIDTFIRIYTENMEMVNAEEYFFFNEQYFRDTFRYLGSHSYLMNVKDDKGEIVTSTILFKYGDYFHYHLSGRSGKAKSWVSNFLFSEAIKHAKQTGAVYFHFGGGRTGSSDDSLLRFKKYFSNSTAVFAIGKKLHKPEIYKVLEEKWNERNPSIRDTYKNYLLKYRILDEGTGKS